MQKEFIVLKEWWRAGIRCIGGFCTLYTFVLYVDWSLKASSSASSFLLFYCVDPPWCFAFWFDHIWSKIMCWSMCTFVSSWEISRTVPLTCFTLDTRMFKDPRKGSVDFVHPWKGALAKKLRQTLVTLLTTVTFPISTTSPYLSSEIQADSWQNLNSFSSAYYQSLYLNSF